MPTFQSMDLPKPSNWQEFETIVRDAQAQRWKSPNLQKNGRTGQKQNGVDIYGPDEIGRPVGIQCKRFKGQLALKDVIDEVGKAEKFKGNLTTLYIATTSEHDASLQQQVRTLSDKRVTQDKFAVAVLFWDEILSGLVLNPAVLKAHYPQINLQTSSEADRERQLAALELGYYGADLWAHILLTYGEFGLMAQTDPDELITALRVLETRAQQLLAPQDASPILDAVSEVRRGCLATKKSESDWDPVELYAKRVSHRVQGALSLLPLAESNSLDIGLQLGRIYHHHDDLPAAKIRKSVETKVRTVLPENSSSAIGAKFTAANKLSSGYRWAMRIYSLVDHELRYSR